MRIYIQLHIFTIVRIYYDLDYSSTSAFSFNQVKCPKKNSPHVHFLTVSGNIVFIVTMKKGVK